MKLIEKLGGYKKAKFEYESLLKYRQFDHTELKSELLEYRREHNIFEPGDIITYNESDFIYKIDTLNNDGLHATTVHEVKRCIIALFGHDNIEHATDEEIAAGHRL